MVDDDPSIRQTLTREMALAGYDAISAADGVEGKARFEERRPDLVITDLAMPRMDGLGLLAAVRQVDATPVLVLSVRGEEEDKVRALDLGADDYVDQALLPARAARPRAHPAPPRRRRRSAEVLRFPGLEIDLARRAVVQEGREIRLTPTELAILELLAGHAGRPVTLRQIIATVWKGAPATTAGHRARARRLAAPQARARPGESALHRHRAVGGVPVPG